MKIEEILENDVIVSFNYLEEYDDLMNHYVLFNDGKNIVGEIVNIKGNKLTIKLIGEIKDNKLTIKLIGKIIIFYFTN